MKNVTKTANENEKHFDKLKVLSVLFITGLCSVLDQSAAMLHIIMRAEF